MSWGTKRPDWTIEYQDNFGNHSTIEIRRWEENAKEIAFTDDCDLVWGHPLEESKWREFVELLERVKNKEISEGSFEYESSGDRHRLNFGIVPREDEYNAYRSDILRFRSDCSHPSRLEGTEGETYGCHICFNIPIKVVLDDLIKKLNSDTPEWCPEPTQNPLKANKIGCSTVSLPFSVSYQRNTVSLQKYVRLNRINE